MSRADLRAARANRVFCTEEKRIRAEDTVMDKIKGRLRVVFIQDRRLRTDRFFIRAQSTIRADGFLSAQYRNTAATEDAVWVASKRKRPGARPFFNQRFAHYSTVSPSTETVMCTTTSECSAMAIDASPTCFSGPCGNRMSERSTAKPCVCSASTMS